MVIRIVDQNNNVVMVHRMEGGVPFTATVAEWKTNTVIGSRMTSAEYAVKLAAGDLMLDRAFDEIVLSTLPPGLSRWLKLDVRHRFEQRFGLPITTVIGQPVGPPPGDG